jgi:GrpB-like predicted nucleotidyltransferase (UPF0157 family)
MTKKVMRLAGEMKTGGTEWNLEEYRGLFKKFGDMAEAGAVTRLMRYSGMAGNRTEMRFFGMETKIDDPPEGMIVLELGNDYITAYRSGDKKPYCGSLKWEWLDRSVPNAPVGDFTACVPAGRASPKTPLPLEFIVTANSRFIKGKSWSDEVHLVDYDPAWTAKYAVMADWLRANTPPEVLLRVEHFGSTAIPGMPAKPVIDILMEVPSFSAARRCLIPLFNRPEYEYWGYDDHILFILRREILGIREYHLHAAPAGKFRERIAFRDYLRRHPDEAKRYADLKYDLAARYPNDREMYTNEKGRVVEEITEKVLREAKG